MNYYYVTTALLLLISGIVAIAYIRQHQEKKKENEVVPLAVGKKTIYLQRKEIPHFQAMSREEQRKTVNKFEAQVKAGRFLPIYKDGKIMGYVKNERWVEIKQNR